jgi:ubiquitin-like protein Pup
MSQAQVKTQPRRSGRSGGEPEGQAGSASPRLAEKGQALADELDGLLEDIDDVLEENAEAFVKGYVQRGGQ